jgi:hypothetical protein
VFYEDLSEYAYQDEDAFTDRESGVYALWYRPAYTRLSIGWLEVGKPYSTGTVPAVFGQKLPPQVPHRPVTRTPCVITGSPRLMGQCRWDPL